MKIKNFIRRLFTQPCNDEYVLWVVENTSRTSPQPLFRSVATEIHHVKPALEIVGTYGNLSKVYCQTLVEKLENDFPFEVEEAIINLDSANLIYYLTSAGHSWSDNGKALMKKKHPLPYTHNVEGMMSPREALIYLANQRTIDYFEASKKIPVGLIYMFANKGYITYTGQKCRITASGLAQAKLYR